MDSKKSPKGRKRTSKGIVVPPVPFPSGDLFWDCSVCTFRNKAEAFKCSMCDVRKGTSTRKPRLNPDIVAAQQAQALTPPPPSTTPTPSGSNSLHWSGDESVTLPGLPDDEVVDSTLQTPLKSNKKVREPKSTKKKEPSKRANANTIPRLKNVDRSSATYHSVTVNDFTVVITEFKPKVKKEKKAKVNKVKPVIIQLHAKNSLASNASTLSVPQDEDSSRTSRSPSVSCDGMGSDENSRPNGHLLSNS